METYYLNILEKVKQEIKAFIDSNESVREENQFLKTANK